MATKLTKNLTSKDIPSALRYIFVALVSVGATFLIRSVSSAGMDVSSFLRHALLKLLPVNASFTFYVFFLTDGLFLLAFICFLWLFIKAYRSNQQLLVQLLLLFFSILLAGFFVGFLTSWTPY